MARGRQLEAELAEEALSDEELMEEEVEEEEEMEEDEEEMEEDEEEMEEDEEEEAPPREALAARPKHTKGVVYMSRIPFGMNPTVLRNHLAQVGPVGRMYLKPKELRGNKDQKKKQREKRLFSEGWVEFSHRKYAKQAALLNCTAVGGSRRSNFHQELWMIKYLPGFSWEDLQEEQVLRKQYMKREVARVQKAGMKAAEEYRKVVAASKSTKRKREDAVDADAADGDGDAPAAKKQKTEGGKKGGKKGGKRGGKGGGKKGKKGGKGTKGGKGGKKGGAVRSGVAMV